MVASHHVFIRAILAASISNFGTPFQLDCCPLVVTERETDRASLLVLRLAFLPGRVEVWPCKRWRLAYHMYI